LDNQTLWIMLQAVATFISDLIVIFSLVFVAVQVRAIINNNKFNSITKIDEMISKQRESSERLRKVVKPEIVVKPKNFPEAIPPKKLSMKKRNGRQYQSKLDSKNEKSVLSLTKDQKKDMRAIINTMNDVQMLIEKKIVDTNFILTKYYNVFLRDIYLVEGYRTLREKYDNCDYGYRILRLKKLCEEYKKNNKMHDSNKTAINFENEICYIDGNNIEIQKKTF